MEPQATTTARVFAIPELLELILLQAALPEHSQQREIRRCNVYDPSSYDNHKDPDWSPSYDTKALETQARGMRFLLCTATRICRHWATVLNNSPILRQTVFMHWSGNDETPRFNPLLAAKFFKGYFHHPLLSKSDGKFWEAMMNKDASWRRMFPVLPPVTRIDAQEQIYGIAENGPQIRQYQSGRPFCQNFQSRQREGQISEGLTMGLLYNIAEAEGELAADTRFRMSWHGDADLSLLTNEERCAWENMKALPPRRLDKREDKFKVAHFADASLCVPTSTGLGSVFTLIPAKKIDRVYISISQPATSGYKICTQLEDEAMKRGWKILSEWELRNERDYR